jgi:hypothetical protein
MKETLSLITAMVGEIQRLERVNMTIEDVVANKSVRYVVERLDVAIQGMEIKVEGLWKNVDKLTSGLECLGHNFQPKEKINDMLREE